MLKKQVNDALPLWHPSIFSHESEKINAELTKKNKTKQKKKQTQ